MKRSEELFLRKNNRVLNVYCTAGYPQFDSTLEVMKSLQAHGADIIELGMPYSDPLADGPVIQQSSMDALANGMTIAALFAQLRDMRKEIHIPVILMGYLNPVMQYGFERFCQDAAMVGIDGLILPDLPEFEFESVYGPVMQRHGLDFIFLVTPETSEARVKKLDSLSTGFLYVVSSSSTTGSDKQMDPVADYLKRLKGYALRNPLLVGFGIKDKASFDAACTYANGAVIGSAYIRAISEASDIDLATKEFLDSVLH